MFTTAKQSRYVIDAIGKLFIIHLVIITNMHGTLLSKSNEFTRGTVLVHSGHLSSFENHFKMACIDMIWVTCCDLFHPSTKKHNLLGSNAGPFFQC